MRKNKLVVYTALFGNYSGLIEQPLFEGVDYICYSDQDLQSNSWKIISTKAPYPNDLTRSNRYFKLNPHKILDNYEQSIYIDANYLIISDFSAMVREKLNRVDMVCFDHNQTILDKRNCVYEEYNELVYIAKKFGVFRDKLESMEDQINFFRQENYPKNNGLIFAAVLIRNHHNKEVIKLMELWWDFVLNRSRRDQLSFNYCVWKQNFNKLEYLNGDLRSGNPWFRWIDHKLDFSKDLKKIKQEIFLKKHLPFIYKILISNTLKYFIFYLKLPYTLFKLRDWIERYSENPISEKEKVIIRKKILSEKSNKKQIRNIIHSTSVTKEL